MEERCVLVPRKDGYWRTAANGDKLPYLDRIEYYELGDDRSAHIAAMQSGQCDIEHEPWVEDYLALKDDPKHGHRSGRHRSVLGGPHAVRHGAIR